MTTETHGSRAPAARPEAAAPPRPGVPELAGVCDYAAAGGPGLTVEENVALLKRYHWVESQLVDMLLARLAGTPEWEVKGGLCLHAWLDAEHAKWLQERVAELRHPPHHFHQPPDPALDAWLQESLRSADTVELLTAVYRVARPALLDAYREHRRRTHPLVDHPTRRILRFIILEEEEMLEWGQAALEALLGDGPARDRAAAWEAHLRAYLAAAGGVAGLGGSMGVWGCGGVGVAPDSFPAPTLTPTSTLLPSEAEKSKSRSRSKSRKGGSNTPILPHSHTPIPSHSVPQPRATVPYEPDWFPRRDGRFESFNYHFPPHWVYAQRERPADERLLALVCKRLLEMDVPEMMAAIIWREKQAALAAGQPKPWAYTAEMCRQVWDEARHSMMGEAWLVNRGVDFTRVPLNVGFSLGLNTHATPREAHAALWWIEQGLMPRTTGKAYEWRTAREAGDPLAALFMDYDWADEVLHVQIGRRWLVKELGSREEAERLGSEAFARVMAIRRRHGLPGARETEQREWWPDFCEAVLGYRPEPLAPEVYETPDEDAPWLKNA